MIVTRFKVIVFAVVAIMVEKVAMIQMINAILTQGGLMTRHNVTLAKNGQFGQNLTKIWTFGQK